MFDLYVVTDFDLSRGRTDVETARLAYEGGADAVQLRMKHTEGMEVGEIARLTGSSPEAVRQNLSRARRNILKHFVNE